MALIDTGLVLSYINEKTATYFVNQSIQPRILPSTIRAEMTNEVTKKTTVAYDVKFEKRGVNFRCELLRCPKLTNQILLELTK